MSTVAIPSVARQDATIISLVGFVSIALAIAIVAAKAISVEASR